MSELHELLPCPHCGGDAEFDVVDSDLDDGNSGGEYIECVNCRCCTQLMFPIHDDVKQMLAETWNKRVPNAK